ncbi:MAG: MFS transporter [Pseudomonadota bacterium]
MTRNIALYPWYKFLHSLIFWQAAWFLYLQSELSAAEAILMYAIYDVATTALEVPSGWLSDNWGRRRTLILSALAGLATAAMQAMGGDFLWFAAAQLLLGIHAAFASGTDTALLYESLAAEDRTDEVERQELRGWRAGFTALALSAISGGLLARFDLTWPYFATSVAMAGLLVVTLAFRDPPPRKVSATFRLTSLKTALTRPILAWLFALTVLMYAFSHVPFVFGQPFILQALDGTGFASETPLVSGAVTAAMMTVSLGVSLLAPGLRARIGLTAMLLLAFALQIALPGTLALVTGPLAILLLLSRMVPDALARPFVLARIQPLLSDESRATYLSLQSLIGRLLFAGTLWLAADATTEVGLMPEADIRRVLGWYAVGGLLCLMGLAAATIRLHIDDRGN